MSSSPAKTRLLEFASIDEQMVTQALISLEQAFRGDDRNGAHALIDRVFEQLAANGAEVVTRATRLKEILDYRHFNQLESYGIYTVGQICERTRTDLTEGPRLQARTVDIIEETLARHGFKLRRMIAGIGS